MIIYFVCHTRDKISNLGLSQFYNLYSGILNELQAVQVAFGYSSLAVVVDTAIAVAAVAAVAVAAVAIAAAVAAVAIAVAAVEPVQVVESLHELV